jgi:LacI family transcriptional regulator
VAFARRLLSDTNFSLAEISARTGFKHVEYLSVAFKRELGQTPREYRKSMPSHRDYPIFGESDG